MTRKRNNCVVFSILFAGCLAAATTILRAENPPASQPSEPKLPAYAIRRLGDLRFADISSSGGFFSADNHQLITFGSDLTIWDVTTGWEIRRYRVQDHLCFFAANFGPHQIAVTANAVALNIPSDILVLEENSGKLVRRIDRQWTGLFNDFAAAPDGSRFAVVTDHLLLCDGKTGQTLRDLGARPARGVRGLFFNPPRLHFSADSTTFLAITFDGQVHIIDAATGNDRNDHTFPASLGAVLSADGKVLAVVQDDRDLHLYELPSGNELPVPPVELSLRPGEPLQRCAVLHEVFAARAGLLAYSYSGPGINLLDTLARPMPLPRRVTPSALSGSPIILSADGSLLAVAAGYGRRTILDTQTGKPVTPASSSMQLITAIAVSPDGQELLVANQQGELFRWDLQHGKLLAHRDRTTAADFVGGGISHLSYFDQGRSVLASGSADARLFNPKTLMTTLRLDARPQGMSLGQSRYVFSSDARWSVDMQDSDLVLTDRKTSTTSVLQHDAQPYSVSFLHPGAISPDGTLLYASCSEGPRLMDLVTRQLGPIIKLKDTTTIGLANVRFSTDSHWITMRIGRTTGLYEARRLLEVPAASEPGEIIENGKRIPRSPISQVDPIWTCDAGGISEQDADFSASSELLALVDSSGANSRMNVTIRELRTGKTLLTLPSTFPAAIAVRFVPDNPVLVTADRAGTALLWDLHAALLAGKDFSTEKSKSDDQLWTALADSDPIPAYRAGLALQERHHLLGRAASLTPIPQSNSRGKADRIQQLIAALSSSVPVEREKSHKSLEGLGSAAIGQIRTALATHPGGELEERLNDIAHVIGADDPSTPAPTLVPASTAPIADPDTLRTARVIQLLEWSGDPAGTAECLRLAGVPATTQKSTSERAASQP